MCSTVRLTSNDTDNRLEQKLFRSVRTTGFHLTGYITVRVIVGIKVSVLVIAF